MILICPGRVSLRPQSRILEYAAGVPFYALTDAEP
jgi:hypothetical protein